MAHAVCLGAVTSVPVYSVRMHGGSTAFPPLVQHPREKINNSCLAFVPRPCIISKGASLHKKSSSLHRRFPSHPPSSVNSGGSLRENEAAPAERDQDLHFITKCEGMKTLETLYAGEHRKHRARGESGREKGRGVREAGFEGGDALFIAVKHTAH